MIAGLLYGQDRPVQTTVGLLLRDCIVRRRRIECRLAFCGTRVELQRAAREEVVWSFVCVDVADEAQVDLVWEVRRLFPEANLMLVVGAGVSPMAYIRPGIMPSCLLDRSATTERVQEAVEDFTTYLIDRCEAADSDGQSFVIEEKDGVTRIPYHSIVCFESRAKRISVRQRREEYVFYDTLDRLQRVLPEQFMRCHRSFIINVGHVRRLSLADNVVEMDDGTSVPVSRSYKASVRGRLT